MKAILRAALLVTLACPGCGAGWERARSLEAMPAAERTKADRVVRHARDAVVELQGLFERGSGVVISPDGLLLTAAHVELASVVAGRFANGREFMAHLLAANSTADWALYRITGAHDLPFLRLAERPAAGQRAIVLGYSAGEAEPNVSAGTIQATALNVPASFVEDAPGCFQSVIAHDAPSFPGDSGGAVLDLEGRLIGITSACGLDGLAIAIPAWRFAGAAERLRDDASWKAVSERIERRVRAGVPRHAAVLEAMGVDDPSPAPEGEARIPWILTGLAEMAREQGVPPDSIGSTRETVERQAIARLRGGESEKTVLRWAWLEFLERCR